MQALPLGGLVPTPAREAALLALFLALDRDGDGLLDQRELYALATALGLRGPGWPMPEDSASHAAAGWALVFQHWCAHYWNVPGNLCDLHYLFKLLLYLFNCIAHLLG